MKRTITLILASMLIICTLGTYAYAAETNIIKSAKITTDIPPKSGYPIERIADGKTNTPGVSDNKLESYSFPYYIELDFGGYTAELSKLKIYTMYGLNSGITNFDVAVMKDGEWNTVRKSIELKWDTSLPTPEERTIYFTEKPTAEKYRLIINNATLNWNEFRIDELEFYGSINGVADKKDISAFKAPYLLKSSSGNTTLPKTIHIKTKSGEEAELNVNWDNNTLDSEGVYSVSGTIDYYTEKPKALVDVYNINKDISAYSGNWAYETIKKSVQIGLLGSIDLSGTKDFTCRDAALIMFRKGKIDMQFISENYTEPEYPIYSSVKQAGLFDGIINGDFVPSRTLTRLEAVKLITKYSAMTGISKTTECDMAYTDIANLSAADKEVLKTAYEYGLIRNAAVFRPNDKITLGEFLSIAPQKSGTDGYIEKEYTDNGKVLKNPYMGFFSYYTDNGTLKYDVDYPNSEYFTSVTGLTSVYIRTPWAFFQPSKDVYDFSLIDAMIEKFKRVGYQICLRITASETGDEYATPKWVFEEGAAEYRWDTSKGGPTSSGGAVAPEYDDPIFLEYLEQFIAELAKRYDGNPNISFLDVGTLGVWGEGHTSNSGYEISETAVRAQLDIYSKYFKKTKVVFMDNTHKFLNVKDYAIEKGFGYRNDSFTGSFDQAPYWTRDRLERLEGFWQQAPVAMELCHYDWMVSNDYWKGGEGLYDLIWDNHASYLGLHGYSLELEKGNHDLFEKLSRRIGYRILPEQVSLSAKAVKAGNLSLKAMWKNLGVAQCYEGAYPAITLKDKDGNIVSVMVDSDFNVNALGVAPEGAAEGVMEENNFKLHALLPGGIYEAYLSLGSLSGTPEIAMPIDGDDGERRYYLGDVTVVGDYKVSAVKNADNSLELTFDVHDTCGSYSYFWPQITFFDASKGERGLAADYTLSLRDLHQNFQTAVTNKSKYTCSAEIKASQSMAGKTYNVYYSMHNLAKGDTVGMMLSDNGRYCPIGTASFDENLNMTFIPAN